MGYHGKMTYKYDLGKLCGHNLSIEIEANNDKEAEEQIYIVRAMIRQVFKLDKVNTEIILG